MPSYYHFSLFRSRSSEDTASYYSTNLPLSKPVTPISQNNRDILSPSTVSGATNSKEYEVPLDNTAYQGLDLSTMTPSKDQYQGLYAQVS